MKELKGFYFGANIGGGEGGAVACDDLGNDYHYTIVEIDGQGAVTQDADHRYNRLTIEDFKHGGVRVLRGVNDNPLLKPGESVEVQLGSQTLTIQATDKKGVTLNGQPSTKANRQLEKTRYQWK